MLTRFPDDYDNFAKYTRFGNIAPYFDRGWCFCESSWAMLTKPSYFLVVLGRATGDEIRYYGFADCSLMHTGSAGRKAPALPDAFEAELHSKGFTNGKDDRPRVAELYPVGVRAALRVRRVAVLRGPGMGGRGGQAAGRGACFGRPAAAAGARPFWQPRGGRGRGRPGGGPPGPGRPAEPAGAQPHQHRVWDEGAAALAAALRAPGALPSLQVLDLGDNRVGAEGAAVLAAALRALGALPRLQLLHLGGNRVGDEGAAALRAAWAAGGRPVDGMGELAQGSFRRGLYL
ncbi:unnamed protein product [Prorocentrum cordatum]|uniref:Uncharacterized protein n=1 Tax=Prorocentrum cordatum TaxID=2364126 RepID=A0ABN9XAZ6_9DINO|nr:unnamed protein product [Polarella glacialis]